MKINKIGVIDELCIAVHRENVLIPSNNSVCLLKTK